MTRGSVFEIALLEDPQDRRKRFWQVTEHVQGSGARVTDSRGLGQRPTQEPPPAQQVAKEPPPGSEPDYEPPPGSGIISPPLHPGKPVYLSLMSFPEKHPLDALVEVGAVYVTACRVAKTALRLVPWVTAPHDRLWDVYHSRLLQGAGVRFHYTPPVVVEDVAHLLNPTVTPWR